MRKRTSTHDGRVVTEDRMIDWDCLRFRNSLYHVLLALTDGQRRSIASCPCIYEKGDVKNGGQLVGDLAIFFEIVTIQVRYRAL